ncbi:MAG: deoxyribonucleoside regulator [bacterium]|jgi:DNA-binding transcriptional regulator LsrR (DeoR family)
MRKKTLGKTKLIAGNDQINGRNSPSNDGWPEQLAVRIARYYYELGLTQQQISAELGIGRARVIRLLAEARERGVVTISINSPLVENLDLAEALVKRFDLDSADVCLAQAEDEQKLARQIGASAGEYVHRAIHNNMTISVGWGMTLREMVMQLDRRSTENVSVVSLLGSLTRMSSVARFQATTELAERLSAECHYLAAPIVCDSQSNRELLTSQPMFKDILKMALSSDLAIVSIGGLDSATIRAVDMVNDEEFHSVRDDGAIGNFLGYYIDATGSIVEHPINQRIIGVSGDEFRKIPHRMMISGGENKVTALLAVLGQGLVSDLVTDSQTAKALLNAS